MAFCHRSPNGLGRGLGGLHTVLLLLRFLQRTSWYFDFLQQPARKAANKRAGPGARGSPGNGRPRYGRLSLLRYKSSDVGDAGRSPTEEARDEASHPRPDGRAEIRANGTDGGTCTGRGGGATPLTRSRPLRGELPASHPTGAPAPDTLRESPARCPVAGAPEHCGDTTRWLRVSETRSRTRILYFPPIMKE